MIIILLGYMGSGKSTIGKALSTKLKMNFIDLDSYIESREKVTIPELFKEKGEIYFRLKEHEYLKELLMTSKNTIIALGGGTPCYAGNMEVLLSYGQELITIYTKAKISTLVERLQNERNNRPLLASLSNDELTSYIAKHLFERSYFYEQAASTVKVDQKNIDQLCDEICELLT